MRAFLRGSFKLWFQELQSLALHKLPLEWQQPCEEGGSCTDQLVAQRPPGSFVDNISTDGDTCDFCCFVTVSCCTILFKKWALFKMVGECEGPLTWSPSLEQPFQRQQDCAVVPNHCYPYCNCSIDYTEAMSCFNIWSEFINEPWVTVTATVASFTSFSNIF